MRFGKQPKTTLIEREISELTTRRIMMVRQIQELEVELSQAKKAKDKGRARIAKTLGEEIEAQKAALDDILLHFHQLQLMGKFQDQVLSAYSRVEGTIVKGASSETGAIFEAVHEGFDRVAGRLEDMRDRQDTALRGIRADHMAQEMQRGSSRPLSEPTAGDSTIEDESIEDIEARLKKRDTEFN